MNNDTTTTMNNEEQEGYVQKIKEQLVSEKQPFWIKEAIRVKYKQPRALVYDTGDTKMGYGLKWNSFKKAEVNDEIAFYPSKAVKCEKKNQDYIDDTYSIELKAHTRKENICARFLVDKALTKPKRSNNGITYTAAFANFGKGENENAELDYIHEHANVFRNNKKIKIYDERDLKIGDFFNLTLYAIKPIRRNTPVLWNYKGDHTF